MAGEAVRGGLVLADESASVAAPWAGRLLALGAILARRRATHGRQLVVAVSVPARDYAAALIGAGWLLARPAPTPVDVVTAAREIAPGTPVRMAVPGKLVADRYLGLDTSRPSPTIQVGGSRWRIELVRNLVAAASLPEDRFGKFCVPEPGSLVCHARRDVTWLAEQCAATPSLALVGTRLRLESDLPVRARWQGDTTTGDRLVDILRPDGSTGAFAASLILAGAKEYVPALARGMDLAVLDGATAIRWLLEITARVVVAIIDRSSTDESAGLAILQLRSTSTLVPLEELRWPPGDGIEALAFEVPT